MACEEFGVLWLLSCLLSSMGAANQIKHNYKRKSVKGLSLFDTEIRLYGKLPWIFFACSLSSTDWWVLSANMIGIAVAILLLLQYYYYDGRKNFLRMACAIFSLLLCLVLTTLVDLKIYSEIQKLLPVFISLFLIPYAARSQYLLNKSNCCSAVTSSRYFLYLMSNMAALAYAFSKIQIVGITDVWPIIIAALIGCIANSILLSQILQYSTNFYIFNSRSAKLA